VAHEAVGVEAGVDALLLAGGEQFGDEILLQHGFATGGGDAATRGIHEVTIAGDVAHQLRHCHLAAALGVPGVAVVAVLAAHQAALHAHDEAYSGAIDGAAGFNGMDPANDPGCIGGHTGFSGGGADFDSGDPINDRHRRLQ